MGVYVRREKVFEYNRQKRTDDFVQNSQKSEWQKKIDEIHPIIGYTVKRVLE